MLKEVSQNIEDFFLFFFLVSPLYSFFLLEHATVHYTKP